MKRRILLYFIAGAVAAVYILLAQAPQAVQQPVTVGPAPEFTGDRPEDWINSEPLRLADLRGNVVLIDFWTFDCWNCYRSFPWLNDLESRLQGMGLRVVGVHTPEFEHEHVRAHVERKVREFGLHHPVMIDNDYRYWYALRNNYWPAFYLLDRKGFVRASFVGETHAGDKRARAIESMLDELLAEGADARTGTGAAEPLIPVDMERPDLPRCGGLRRGFIRGVRRRRSCRAAPAARPTARRSCAGSRTRESCHWGSPGSS
jgi:thiol-disulfide isomerase/thioredoxin